MRPRSVIAAVLATAGAVLLFSPAGGAVGTLVQQAVTDPPAAPTAGPGEPSPPIPWLTDAQKAEARDVVARDPRVKAIFGGTTWEVRQIGPWTAGQRLVGAGLVIRLSAPRTFPVTHWPAIQDDWPRFPPYRERTLAASASGVTDFDALIDLNRDRLVSLRPTNAEKTTIAPGQSFPTPGD